MSESAERDVAVIGLAGRFPRSGSVEEYWHNLASGAECISFFSEHELSEAGVDAALLADPRYVRATGYLEGCDRFDAEFFGMTPKEAEITDPQQRLFLECAWEALENAGYEPASYPGAIGVFAGASLGRYLFEILARREALRRIGAARVQMGNDRDFLSTWVSYKLDLRGPSLSVQTACSSSLVAVHLACQSLLGYESDMALAGGVSVRTLRPSGYLFEDGGIHSPDGRCRAFDAGASGTVSGDGAGVVVLKRLGDARREGDRVHAVIRGSAINNDGRAKAGFTAPSVAGQARVIAEALAVAGVAAEQVRFIEAHGTGTALGDPIEIAALREVFRGGRRGSCAIGSVKSNIGHLDAAAGIAGLIKAVEALNRRTLPPSLHFVHPNPALDLAASPFYVNSDSEELGPEGGILYAGVSSFGIGGTNAHVVLQEAPVEPPPAPDAAAHLVVLSARSPEALAAASSRLARHLRQNPRLGLADVAYTEQVGRRAFGHRRALVSRSLAEAAEALERLDSERVVTAAADPGRPVAFLFSGQGTQHAGMAAELFAEEAVFRRELERCAEALRPHLGLDLREALYPPAGAEPRPEHSLDRTGLAQAVLFAVEWSLAHLWMSWGVQPAAMIGHSVGEYVAACLAGVFSLADGLALIATRGRLMEATPEGSMLAVPLAAAQLAGLLPAELSIAAVNGPAQSVLAGPPEAVAACEERLRGLGLRCRRLSTRRAFHSAAMDPVLAPFHAELTRIRLEPPRRPFVSNLTGDWVRPDEVTRPEYWCRHLRGTVRFGDGLARLLEDRRQVLLEVGPGATLAGIALRHPGCEEGRAVLHSLPSPREGGAERDFVLGTLGRLWAAGVPVEWQALHAGETRRRVPLPTYPFERRRCWIEEDRPGVPARPLALRRAAEVADWMYLPSWRRADRVAPAGRPHAAGPRRRVLVVLDGRGLGERIARRLEAESQEVVRVALADRFARLERNSFTLDGSRPEDYRAFVSAFAGEGWIPSAVVHLASVEPEFAEEAAGEPFARIQEKGFYSLLWLAQALEASNVTSPVRILAVTSGVEEVAGTEALAPEKATLLGPCRVLPQEQPNLSCCSVDIPPPAPGSAQERMLIEQLLDELAAAGAESRVAYRGGHRWVSSFRPLGSDCVAGVAPLRHGGVYLLTGGLGRIGLVLADYLAREFQAKLILTSRTPLPEPARWSALAQSAGAPQAGIARRLAALVAQGAEVEVAAVDVADRDGMRDLLARVEARFGVLHGVIHCAGQVGTEAFQLIRETGREHVERQFQAKVHGLLVLAELLRGRAPDFVVLMSSLSSILGGLGFAAYAAANLFMDAFAAARWREGERGWVSVNWDGWRASEVGRSGEGAEGLAIQPEEGARALALALGLATPQVAVSTASLEARLARWVEREEVAQASGAGPAREVASAITDIATAKRLVADTWRDLLGIDPSGEDADFFALGGDSLLAIRLAGRLREAFGIALSVRTVFEHPTVAGMARAAMAPGSRGLPPVIARAPRERGLPLSFSQQRLWFLEQFQAEAPPYNTFSPLVLTGLLDRAALTRGLGEILRRHEALRTVFPVVEGTPVQVVLPAGDFRLPLIDLAGLGAKAGRRELRELAAAAARRRFNLARGPLFQALLLRLDESEHCLCLAIHHIVCDGWSVGIFVRELSLLYDAYARGLASPLGDLPVQYADFAAWQREWLQGEALATQLAYWRSCLAGMRELALPADFARPSEPSFRGATESLTLPQEVGEACKALAHRLGATLFMSLLAAFKALLHHHTGQDDIVVGTNVAGRNRPEIEGAIGFFVNNLTLRTDLTGDPTFEQLVRRVQTTVIEAFDHQELPFEKVVEVLRPEREHSRHPLFQVMFVLQIPGEEEFRLPGLELRLLELPKRSAAFDLLLNMRNEANGLSGSVEYSTDLFSAATIRQLLQRYAALLARATADPARPLSSLLAPTGEQEEDLARAFTEDLAELV